MSRNVGTISYPDPKYSHNKNLIKYLLIPDRGAGDEQAGDHRGPFAHLCPGNDNDDDDDMMIMIMTDGPARAGHLPGPRDLLSLLGPRNLQRQQKCT